ncbi:MAG TPA: hypothetical protein VKU77_06605 [Streptosporangiaceae bacterium]|nr:hypothetical protein [Streptosporangiaceae bacterium]
MSGYLVPDTDRHDRASALSCLGTVALERFADARAAGEGEPLLLEHLNAALRSYRQFLELTPPMTTRPAAPGNTSSASSIAGPGTPAGH